MMQSVNAIKKNLNSMRAAIYALMLRNIEENFIVSSNPNRLRDLLRIFLEPVAHVALWSMIKSFRYKDLENELDTSLFILLGVLPWLFTHGSIANSLNIIKKNKALLCFKQIKLMDPVIALLLSELITITFVFCISLLVFYFLEIEWRLEDPLCWFFALLFYVLTVMGLAFFVSCLAFFSKNIGKFFSAILRSMYLFSGIFFSARMLSPDWSQYLTYNPLFQFIELSRSAFSNEPLNTDVGLSVLAHSALVCMFIGLGTYTLLRKKIMTEIMND
ncbi:ABC transporter permease [Legionella shakespearei]|uniref:ABC transporter permease n=2 Tax=Legionella shakespearei TaxID=45075 RepID=A0A0W0Z5S4_9GAMM|nr:ABC transporter permease [Legionella shakespearei]KTD64191.1 ABC transporter permease [Legionella shakespearei DSM 23087]